MKHTIIILVFFMAKLSYGQAFDSFMQIVEQNNPRIIAMQKWLEAEETKAKMGIYPDNPEVSYTHLWGSPESIGNQQELEISQSFKLPGYYTSKSAVQKLNFQQKQALAEMEKREILHTARTAWFNLVWLHKKEALLKSRKEDAEKLVAIMQEGFEGGEISKPAFDKARIYNIGVQSEWQKVQSEIEVQNQYLRQLSGNNTPEGLAFEYPLDWEVPVLDAVLSNLSESNPDLVMAQLGIQQAEKEVKHQRMKSLPSLKAGYKSETILDQKFQGLHAGVSIPLWQNSNNVKHARLQTEWSRANLSQQESELKMEVSGLFYEILALSKNHEQMRQIMEEETVSGSSLELLHSGQISFTEYLVDTELIWDAQSQFLLNEKAFFELLSRFKTFE
jgi:outer membrane protein, heavy metal efflux system